MNDFVLLGRGEVIGIVGESGSSQSTAILGVLGLTYRSQPSGNSFANTSVVACSDTDGYLATFLARVDAKAGRPVGLSWIEVIKLDPLNSTNALMKFVSNWLW